MHIIFTLLGLALLSLIDNTIGTRIIFFACYAAVIIFNKDKNIVTLVVTIMIFKIVEITTHEALANLMAPVTPGFVENNVIFGTHLFYDLLLWLVIAFRAPIWRQILKTNKQIHLIKADMGLFVVYTLFILADALALGENILRHLDAIGFSLETAKNFSGVTLIWDNYENIKRTMICLEFLVVWLMITTVANQKLQAGKVLQPKS